MAWRSPRGVESRRQFEINRGCCDFNLLQALRFTAVEGIYGPIYPSEIGQDKWVIGKIFPGVTNGFFLDVGSGHGTIGSNTKALEDLGWSGICIDPFPTHMEGRTCQMLREFVFDKAGERVQFHQAEDLGGISDTLGAWKERASQAPLVEFTTVTLADILERTHAPKTIDFMSLDIEGAELAALKGFPFDKYSIGALAVEHNYEEPKRTDIQKFLAAHGMERVGSIKQDDLYVKTPAGK